jgi:hypothetical protein
VGIATSYYVYRETNRILSNYDEEHDEEDALEQGGRSVNHSAAGTAPWLEVSDERRGFLEGDEGNVGSLQYARRSNNGSALWEREGDDDDQRR